MRSQENPLYMPNMGWPKKAADYLNEMMEQKDSCGGIIECRVTGLPVGLGEPVFDKLDAQLSKGIMSIGAVKSSGDWRWISCCRLKREHEQ